MRNILQKILLLSFCLISGYKMNVKISFISLLSLFFIGCSSVPTNIEVDEISLLPPIIIPIYEYRSRVKVHDDNRSYSMLIILTEDNTRWDQWAKESNENDWSPWKQDGYGEITNRGIKFFAFQNRIKGTIPIYSQSTIKGDSVKNFYVYNTHQLGTETYYVDDTFGIIQLTSIDPPSGHYYWQTISDTTIIKRHIDSTLTKFFAYPYKDKPIYFLENLDSLNLLGDNSNIIKKELRKIENEIKEKIDIPYISIKIKEAVTERVITSSSMSNRNKDLLLQATLENPNMTPYEYKYLEQQLSQNTYATREISPREETRKNTVITFNKDLFSIKPEWKDIVDFYGGYSELVNKNINKIDYDLGLYNTKVKLSSFELLNSNECLAIVDISGELELNNIPKNQYKYKGTYKIEDFEMTDIYLKNIPNVIFSFENKKYLGSSNEFSMPIDSITKLNIPFDNYISIIDLMFDDIISDEEFIKILINNLGEG